MIYLSITIDTEEMNTPFWRGDYDTPIIRHKNTTGLLNEIFNHFQVKATYFTSVFQEWYFQDGEVQKLLGELKDADHDIQLHTHPIWIDPKRREHMWMFTLEEQIDLLEKGVSFIEKHTGKAPLAHRAGAYGLNHDTLKALKETNVPLDSSMYYGHSNCKVQWTKNSVLEKDGLVIYPISCFDRVTKVMGVSVKQKIAKTDIDSCSLDELIKVIEKFREEGVRVYDFFLHSYSLLKRDVRGNRFEVCERQVAKLKGFLKYISEQEDIEVITVSDFYNRFLENKTLFNYPDIIPSLVRKTGLIGGVRKMISK